MVFIDNYEHVLNSVFYIEESILGQGVDPAVFYSQFKSTCSCSCYSSCVDQLCKCISLTGRNYFNSLLNLDKLDHSCIYECGVFCSCNFSTCSNKVVQKGPNPRLEVRFTPTKGYGLFTLEDMLPGTFVCEYAGELISKRISSVRCSDPENAKYILTLREHYGQNVIENYIDAYMFSNIGRYANHSCSPNSTIVPTRTGSIIPRAAIFTTIFVNKNEEITYSYGDGAQDNVGLGSKCYCESDKCVGYLPASFISS